MQTVSILDLRRDAHAIVERVHRGQRLVLTYRGKAMLRLEPMEAEATSDDPFYALADQAGLDGESISNKQMDEVVYGA